MRLLILTGLLATLAAPAAALPGNTEARARFGAEQSVDSLRAGRDGRPAASAEALLAPQPAPAARDSESRPVAFPRPAGDRALPTA
jgi:hypothetical protein